MPDRDSTIELLNGLILILISSKLFPRVSNRETIPTQCRFSELESSWACFNAEHTPLPSRTVTGDYEP